MVQRYHSRLVNRERPVNFFVNLILASLAGIVNVLVTMPLDVVITR